jgi:hypothetical protein
MSDKRYIVTGEYVTMQTTNQLTGEPVLLGYYRGQLLPGDITEESIEHHLSTGQIEEVAVDNDGAMTEPEQAEDLRQTDPSEAYVTDGLGEPNKMPGYTPTAADEPDKAADEAPTDARQDALPEPRRNADRDAWVEYAVSKGADRGDIEAQNPSKADLIAAWGTPRS